MYQATVSYLGKTYTHKGDSIDCKDWMVAKFGKVEREYIHELHTHGFTRKGAEFWMQEA